MTMAEFFMIRPQGPNFGTGLGAFSDLVLLKQTSEISLIQVGGDKGHHLTTSCTHQQYLIV